MNIDNMSFIRKLLAKTYGAIRSRIQFQIARMRLFLANNLQYGAGSRAYGGLRTRITDGGSCILGKNVTIERNVELSACKGVISIGSNSFIGQGSVIVAHNKISIGKSCLIAEYVSIRDQNHEFGASKLTMESGFKNLPINIGDNVWIGAKASVLAGVNIGQNSVVGAGSVVTRDIPENSVVVGVPGRIVKSLIRF